MKTTYVERARLKYSLFPTNNLYKIYYAMKEVTFRETLFKLDHE